MDTQEKETVNFGLLPLKPDGRDFSLGGVFGVTPLADVPSNDFIVAWPLKIKDQGDTDFCTAYTVTEVSEDQEEVELDANFQFAAICKERGDIKAWGSDLREAFLSAVKVGSLEAKLTPAHMKEGDRDYLATWGNWPETCFQQALQHRKQSVFKVDGPYDLFDNIRAAMWKFRAENRTVGVGSKWRNEWTMSTTGIIDESNAVGTFGHAFKIFGQKIINGNLYLCAQLSNGKAGDGGIYYFSREVVNKEFAPFGQFMFQDMPRETAELYHAYGIKVSDNWLRQIFKIIKSHLTFKK